MRKNIALDSTFLLQALGNYATKIEIIILFPLMVWMGYVLLTFLALGVLVCFGLFLSSSCVPNVNSFSDCPFLISPSVFSNVYFVLCLVCPVLPVSLDCPMVIAVRFSLTVHWIMTANWYLHLDNELLVKQLKENTPHFTRSMRQIASMSWSS